MTRSTPHPQFADRTALATAGACCCGVGRMVAMPAVGLAWGPWAVVYRLAYEAAVERVSAEDSRRRRFGHVAPSLN